MVDGKRITVPAGIPRPSETRIRKPAVKVYPDGREVCQSTHEGFVEYARRRTAMWYRDKGICCICHLYCPRDRATFEHKDGRGMGGSRRDDRMENNGIAHPYCNSEKGSRRM